MRQDLKKPCPFFIFLFISEDDIMSSRSIRNHCDRISDFFFDKLNVVSAVLRKIFVFLDSSDVAFPSRKCLEYWFDCVASKYGCRMQGATDVAFTVLMYLDTWMKFHDPDPLMFQAVLQEGFLFLP